MTDQQYEEGKKAFAKGNKRFTCPYEKFSEERNGWMLGWDTANEQDARAILERKMGIRD